MPFIVLDPSTAAEAPTTSVGAPKTGTGKTLASMRAELQRMLQNRADIDVDIYNTWLNDAYVDVATSLKLDELRGSVGIEIVAGQPFYLLPYVVAATQLMTLIDTTLIDKGVPLSKTDKDSYRLLPDATGRPESFFREGDMLVLYPTPDKDYLGSLDFRVRPLPLVEDTDSPMLGVEWHRAIVLRARQSAFDDLLEFDKALPAENSANNNVRRRTDREAEEDAHKVIRSSVPGRERRRFSPWHRDF